MMLGSQSPVLHSKFAEKLITASLDPGGPKKHEGNETKYACCPNRGLRYFIIVRGFRATFLPPWLNRLLLKVPYPRR